MKQWNEAFKKYGKVFLTPQEDMPEIVKVFKKNKVEKILDLGCGSGRHAVYLASRGFDVYGFDIADAGIKIAKEWLKQKGLIAEFKIGSIYPHTIIHNGVRVYKKLPYGNNFLDAIISTNAIHHEKIENVRKAIREIERVLKPGGLIFITVRKRKFRKFYPKLTIIEKYGQQKTNYQIIADRTYAPTSGVEKGLPHYLFNKELIRKEFNSFKINNIWVDNNGRHYCFIGQSKNK